ncbi:hypothetical protein B0T09DRAFT_362731 [Sordaria sp. MPI-SDFR-AT-0083]|nr:hypothetical protein B0T09DRAFT_362731 [Sordaria sp. MPI-SDFR-AT-0083]
MRGLVSLAGCLGVFHTLVAGATIPSYFEGSYSTPRKLSVAQVQRELGSRLTKTSIIFGPEDTRYKEATSRWNVFANPKFQIIVEPGQESDVASIVKYCNEKSIDFLAINKGHGFPSSLGSFNGVQINLAQFRNISIQPNSKSAWFGGGVYDGQANRYLWDQGYVTTTGSCDCVGMMGPGLGGGHGRHEGLYGMISDNILQLNVVLANGTAIRVNKTSHKDLLWAMKGAGHNFGIVTGFEMKIYPRGPDTWHYHNYVWRGEQLEAVFTALNNFHRNGSTPVNMTTNFGNMLMDTTITDKEPVLWWTFAYRGSAAEAERHLAPFNAIKAVRDEQGDVPYPQVAATQQTDEESAICQHNQVRITATAGLQMYNLTAERLIFEGFKKRVASDPTLAAGGVVLHEGYSTAAVDAQSPDDSAYPFRDDHHLMLVQIIIPPKNKTIENEAWKWAKEVRDQWNKGQPTRPVNAYVNYANGFESVEEHYGHEAWRVKKLRDLKVKYDPFNRFRFYNPIIGKKAVGPI